MSNLHSERETAAGVSYHIMERRNGRDRREQADRRAEPRFGDVIERRDDSDRRCTIGNPSLD